MTNKNDINQAIDGNEIPSDIAAILAKEGGMDLMQLAMLLNGRKQDNKNREYPAGGVPEWDDGLAEMQITKDTRQGFLYAATREDGETQFMVQGLSRFEISEMLVSVMDQHKSIIPIVLLMMKNIKGVNIEVSTKEKD